VEGALYQRAARADVVAPWADPRAEAHQHARPHRLELGALDQCQRQPPEAKAPVVIAEPESKNAVEAGKDETTSRAVAVGDAEAGAPQQDEAEKIGIGAC